MVRYYGRLLWAMGLPNTRWVLSDEEDGELVANINQCVYNSRVDWLCAFEVITYR